MSVSYEQTVINRTSFKFYNLESSSRQVWSFVWVVQKYVLQILNSLQWDSTETNYVQRGREKKHCHVSFNILLNY